MRAAAVPAELMLPESLGSWGDWTVQSPQTMRAMVAIAAAHGVIDELLEHAATPISPHVTGL